MLYLFTPASVGLWEVVRVHRLQIRQDLTLKNAYLHV